ncbi:MAG: segregation and condensation protein A [Hominimerdicola sp.]
MGSAQFKLDKFEGPLDLLLHLISKHKLNIYDIEISLLLEQYLEYIENLDHDDFEGAADFLEMAARLIYIKTCQLLPHDEEVTDLKKELEGRIIEYSLCKMAAQSLRELYAGGDIFVRNPMKIPVDKTYTRKHDPQELYRAYMGLSEKARRNTPLKANIFEPIVSHKIVSVTSKIIYILKRLYINGECELDHLYDGMTGKSERVATFLAVLELTKSGRIFLNDDNSRIYFNKTSRKKKIKSDFDNENQSSEPQTFVAGLNEDSVSEEPPVPLDKLELEEKEADEVYRKPEYKSFSDYKPKPVKSDNSVSCAAEISGKVMLSEEFIDCDTEQTISGDLIENITECENLEELCPEFVENRDILEKNAEPDLLEEQIYDEHSGEDCIVNDMIDNIYNSDEFKKEFEILSMLSKEPPKNLFKPNYWAKRRYRWGYSPTGDDVQNNYWRFG